MKPDREPFFKYYLLSPIEWSGSSFIKLFRDIPAVILISIGWWRCTGCKRLYSSRIKKYHIFQIYNKTKLILPEPYCSVCIGSIQKTQEANQAISDK